MHSFRMLASSERRRQHLPWVNYARAKAKGVDLRPLRAVIPPVGYIPDFLTPAPPSTFVPPRFAEELEVVRSTEPEHFVEEVAWMVADACMPSVWRSESAYLHQQMLADPVQAIKVLTELLDTYWRLLLEPHWRRMYGALHLDIRSRMRVMESSGSASVFSSLNKRVAWDDDRLAVRSDYTFEADLGGQGLVLIPSIFCGPEVLTMLPPLQSMIVYPRPGAAEFWNQETEQSSPLAALLGSVRAAVVGALVIPASTGELASAIGVTPSAISQHIGVLRDCGLVMSRRVRRRVVHSLTETGEALVRSVGMLGGLCKCATARTTHSGLAAPKTRTDPADVVTVFRNDHSWNSRSRSPRDRPSHWRSPVGRLVDHRVIEPLNRPGYAQACFGTRDVQKMHVARLKFPGPGKDITSRPEDTPERTDLAPAKCLSALLACVLCLPRV